MLYMAELLQLMGEEHFLTKVCEKVAPLSAALNFFHYYSLGYTMCIAIIKTYIWFREKKRIVLAKLPRNGYVRT